MNVNIGAQLEPGRVISFRSAFSPILGALEHYMHLLRSMFLIVIWALPALSSLGLADLLFRLIPEIPHFSEISANY